MQENELVSIIVPMYNVSKYVVETIESVFQQTYTNWELILIDDGSTDDTASIVKPYLSDQRVKYIYQKNGGIGNARNNAIKNSSGTFVAPLDADDLWDPEKLEVQVEKLRETGAAAVFCKVRRIDQNGKNLDRDMGIGSGSFTGFKSFFLMGLGRIIVPNLTVVIRKDILNGLGNYRESGDHVDHIEDFDLWARLMLNGHNLFGIDQVLASYRVHSAQLTNTNDLNISVIGLLEHMCADYPGKRRYFKMLIMSRYLMSINSLRQTRGRQDISWYIDQYMKSPCIQARRFEPILMRLNGFEKYLYYRMLVLRRFKRLPVFLNEIGD